MNIHLQTILGFTRLPGDRPYFLTISGGDDLQVRLDIESLDSKRKRDKMGLEPRSRKGRPSERFGPPLGLAQKKADVTAGLEESITGLQHQDREMMRQW
jgi:hypothetical protein